MRGRSSSAVDFHRQSAFADILDSVRLEMSKAKLSSFGKKKTKKAFSFAEGILW